MSTNKDVVESVLSEEPKKCQAIAEETGLEVRAVSNCLNQLRVTGRAQRADGGWIAGEAAAQKVRRHEAVELDHDAPPPQDETKIHQAGPRKGGRADSAHAETGQRRRAHPRVRGERIGSNPAASSRRRRLDRNATR